MTGDCERCGGQAERLFRDTDGAWWCLLCNLRRWNRDRPVVD